MCKWRDWTCSVTKPGSFNLWQERHFYSSRQECLGLWTCLGTYTGLVLRKYQARYVLVSRFLMDQQFRHSFVQAVLLSSVRAVLSTACLLVPVKIHATACVLQRSVLCERSYAPRFVSKFVSVIRENDEHSLVFRVIFATIVLFRHVVRAAQRFNLPANWTFKVYELGFLHGCRKILESYRNKSVMLESIDRFSELNNRFAGSTLFLYTAKVIKSACWSVSDMSR